MGTAGPRPSGDQLAIDLEVWRAGAHTREYAHRTLQPVEVLLLIRHREQLAGRRVLEVGCGAGRILGYLAALTDEAHGIDIAASMVDHCRAHYPRAHVTQGDATDPAAHLGGRFDAILAMDNYLDIYGDADRRRVLANYRELLAPDGILIFSSHNLEAAGGSGARATSLAGFVAHKTPAELVAIARRVSGRRRNRRTLKRLEQRHDGYAILNDSAHDFSLLHYYIGRDGQERQLRETGYELLECLEVDGAPIEPGRPGGSPWLHYVARVGGPASPGE